MKVGILTYHRAHNYGAVLQCYALKETLTKMGHNVYVLDYRQPDIEKVYSFHRQFSPRTFFAASLKEKLVYIPKYLYKDIKQFFILKQKRKVFEDFRNKYLSLSEKIIEEVPLDFDAYVIGSDMLWADDCMYGNFDQIYMGNFAHNQGAKVIGYAISGSTSSFERLGRKNNFAFLSNFDAYSIREKMLADVVSKYINNDVRTCIDPTLLTTKELWTNILEDNWSHRSPYIIKYYLRIKEQDKLILDKKIDDFANKYGYEVLSIDVSQTAKPITVPDFVSSIANAKHIVTDSFHGIIFSLIFNRSFQAMRLYDSHDARYVDLLNKIGLQCSISDINTDINHIDINYKLVEDNFENYRRQSLMFLNENLC